MKILLNFLFFLGLMQVYTGTSEIFKKYGVESKESSAGEHCGDNPAGSCSGCARC
jgi:hypothetical protein